MKFTDGFWQLRPGVTALYAQEAYDIWHTADTADGEGLVVTAPTARIAKRGDTLNRAVLTTTLSSPMEGVVRVRIAHHDGGAWHGGFELPGATGAGKASLDESGGVLETGALTARITSGAPWDLSFEVDGRRVTGSGHKAQGYVQLSEDAQVDPGIVGDARTGTTVPRGGAYVHEQLDLGVGELVYGLGERFGPLVKNGQSVEVWNADGGTSSEQAYKNVPFHLSSRGYGVLVNDSGHVSYEIGSEAVERVQFSVAGEVLEYFVIAGPTPKDVLSRYTALTGRPPVVPAWSYGLWLSTSFTTDYDEATVTSFIDEMSRRDLPVSVFHFDCFWMREFNWCDFEWDPRVFPEPDAMLQRLHEKDLRVSVWINPYIGQRSPLFREAADQGFLVTRPDGSVWQWDMWQAGMALVDFTNPHATAWYQSHLRRLVEQGVRFVQLFLKSQPWDTHSKNARQLSDLTARTDQPCAALVTAHAGHSGHLVRRHCRRKQAHQLSRGRAGRSTSPGSSARRHSLSGGARLRDRCAGAVATRDRVPNLSRARNFSRAGNDRG